HRGPLPRDRALLRGTGAAVSRDLRRHRPRARCPGAGRRRTPDRRAMADARRALTRARRVVVKVGSGLVAAPDQGPLGPQTAGLAGDLAAVVKAGREVALVSSGAIATGMVRLGLTARPRSIPEKQAAAAVGQSALMWRYEQAFESHGIRVGQVLLTGEDISDRSRYLNARNTLLALLGFGVLPIVNENDTVAVEEIKVGDNDN